jgi:anti-sigma regulatory factor (Ser/Thr protein kinase)
MNRTNSASAAALAMLEHHLPATASELHCVRRYAEDAADEFGLRPTDRYEFVFAVNEAVTNAIRHGRPFRDGTIALRIDADGDTLICSVSDSGRFDGGPAQTGVWAEGGRGLAAMALVMDQIEFCSSPTGTTIRLHKRRSEAAEPSD